MSAAKNRAQELNCNPIAKYEKRKKKQIFSACFVNVDLLVISF